MTAKFCDVTRRLVTVSPRDLDAHIADCLTCQAAREALLRKGVRAGLIVREGTSLRLHFFDEEK